MTLLKKFTIKTILNVLLLYFFIILKYLKLAIENETILRIYSKIKNFDSKIFIIEIIKLFKINKC